MFAAGILKLEVDLIRELPSRKVVSAKLDVVCNIQAVPLLTGQEEGFALDVDGISFEPEGVGITLFSTVGDERD